MPRWIVFKTLTDAGKIVYSGEWNHTSEGAAFVDALRFHEQYAANRLAACATVVEVRP